MERQFDQQIEKLKRRILKMSSLIDEQVDAALRVVSENDTELVKIVLEREDKVDKYDLKIDKICQKIIALNQPVAMDLRLIMSALTINTNLERIGDIAVNIVESHQLMRGKRASLEKSRFFDMAKLVREMIRNAIDSFINSDPKLAQKVIETDQRLDEYNRENYDNLIDHMKKNPDDLEPSIALLIICRQMERLGDHATNIAEDVYFIVEAQMIKHKYEKFIFTDDEDDDEEEPERSRKE